MRSWHGHSDEVSCSPLALGNLADSIHQTDFVKGYESVEELRYDGPAQLEWTDDALEAPVFLARSQYDSTYCCVHV